MIGLSAMGSILQYLRRAGLGLALLIALAPAGWT